MLSPPKDNSESLGTSTPLFIVENDEQILEEDKKKIYKHPLFPLLALLFEKCELATRSMDTPSNENFNSDLRLFLHQQQSCDPTTFLSDNDETNELMIKAIQVLRIHLLELEKVQELCKDFCSRYISCLKGRMQSENLLRSDINGGYESDEGSLSSRGPSSTHHNIIKFHHQSHHANNNLQYHLGGGEQDLPAHQGSEGGLLPFPVLISPLVHPEATPFLTSRGKCYHSKFVQPGEADIIASFDDTFFQEDSSPE